MRKLTSLQGMWKLKPRERRFYVVEKVLDAYACCENGTAVTVWGSVKWEWGDCRYCDLTRQYCFR